MEPPGEETREEQDATQHRGGHVASRDRVPSREDVRGWILLHGLLPTRIRRRARVRRTEPLLQGVAHRGQGVSGHQPGVPPRRGRRGDARAGVDGRAGEDGQNGDPRHVTGGWTRA